MPVLVIVQGKIQDRAMLEEYSAQAGAMVRAHQGKLIAFDEQPETVEGKNDRPRTVVLEFPSKAAFRAWYDSPEYQKVLPLRLKSAPGTLIVVNGK